MGAASYKAFKLQYRPRSTFGYISTARNVLYISLVKVLKIGPRSLFKISRRLAFTINRLYFEPLEAFTFIETAFTVHYKSLKAFASLQ